MENTILDQNTQGRPVQPKNYLVESILVTLFCCFPPGIVAIINASKVDSRYASGDFDGAQQASDEAKKWMKYALIGSVVFIVLYLIFVFAMVGTAASQSGGF
jgi:hypothetical protein